MNYNSRVFSILTESSKACKAAKYECGEECGDFEDTLKGIGSVDCTIPADAVPVMKKECSSGEECGNCNEQYLVNYNILSIYTEDNNYNDEVEALYSLCEHYNLDINDMTVVFESDETNKEMINKAKKNKDASDVRKHNNALKNFKNNGIRVAKKK